MKKIELSSKYGNMKRIKVGDIIRGTSDYYLVTDTNCVCEVIQMDKYSTIVKVLSHDLDDFKSEIGKEYHVDKRFFKIEI